MRLSTHTGCKPNPYMSEEVRRHVGASDRLGHVEAVVVGGGVYGASMAFHLARRGTQVLLIEQGRIGGGATGHSGALVRQHYESRVGVRLARKSLAFFRRFGKETGGSCDFRTTGFLSGVRAADVPAFDALLGLLASEGVRAERLSPQEAAALEPGLDASDYEVVVHDPDAGYADPIATATGFASGARIAGASIVEGSAVRGIAVRRGRVAGLRLRGGGTVDADRVVVAAGNWTPELLAGIGVDLPIRFVRGNVAILRRPPGSAGPARIHFDFYHGTYSRPEEAKDVLVGFMETDLRKVLRSHVLRDDSVPTATVRDLRARLSKRFPAMARSQPRGGWAGVYDVTPDSYPIVDAVGPEGLFVAAGFSGHGFKLAPEIGRLLAEYVASGRRPEELAALREPRFREGDAVRPEAPFPAARGPRLP
jgi:glycine/D-amino acid oxidase-like deaminating enzyme